MARIRAEVQKKKKSFYNQNIIKNNELQYSV